MTRAAPSIFLAFLLLTLFLSFHSVSMARTIPSLSKILAASQYLVEGDIPEDSTTTQGKTPIYVATNGDDHNNGLSITSPKEHLGAAIEYANSHPATPFVVYLRGGTYYRPAAYEYLDIKRGNLIITAYPGERVFIRPSFWPNNPTSWGEEVFLYSFGPYDNITISNLNIQGWGVPFIFGTQFDQPPMRNIVIKNIHATEFRKRDPAAISEFFSTNYVSRGYFAGNDFDPNDSGIKYQIEDLILSNIYIEGVDMPVNIGDEDDANVEGLRISGVEVRNEPQGSGSTAVDGFALVNCYRVLIDNCIIDQIEGDGIDAKSFNVCVINTYLHGIGRNAVKFWHNGEVINSIIYDADADAAFVIGKGPCRMIHSILMKKGDGYAGTFAYDEPSSEKFEVVNSIFIDLDHTFYLGTPDLRSQHSLYYDMPGGLYSGQVSASTAADLNSLNNCFGNIWADPLFSLPEREDFTPLPGSPCFDAGISSGVLLPSFDYYGNPRTRGRAPDIGPIEASLFVALEKCDYDGDGTSDIAVFRGSSGRWALRGITRFYFGSAGDLPVPGDYDSDGTTDIGIFRPSSGLWVVRGLTRTYYGTAADMPVPSDYNGDGTADVAVFRPASGLWAVRNLSRVYFGSCGDTPVPGGWDGDGCSKVAIFRQTSGLWVLRGISRFYFGTKGDIPVPHDYDGDGTRDPAVFRPSSGLWAVRGLTRSYFGAASYQPVPADYDGDSTADIGLFRNSSGLWVLKGSTRIYHGTAGDIPVTR